MAKTTIQARASYQAPSRGRRGAAVTVRADWKTAPAWLTPRQAGWKEHAPSQRADRRPQQVAGEKRGLNRIESGERARLIPVTSSRQKELAAVSVVLAVFRIVPEFAKVMLEEVGAPTSKRSRLTAMTEICFKKPKHTRATLPRPDGLLVVDTGHREWVALLEASIADWHQLCPDLALTLSTSIGKRVAIALGRKHKKNPQARVDDHINTLMNRYRLADDFPIPNTAGNIHLEADLRRRTISLSMRLNPPGDKKRPTAAVNWLTRQLRDGKIQNLLITCYWPRRIEPTTLNIAEAIEHPEDLVPEGVSELPIGLEVKRVVDLAGKFRGAKTMVESTQMAFVEFYRQVGQNLTPWRASPPRYKDHGESEKVATSTPEDITIPAFSVSDKKL